jgi:peptidoglycan/LPS O-acetylase OafA/YrhL
MILTIQYLRGIAALLVLLHHVAWKNEQHGENLLGWLRIGEAGVDIFFVVSGFVMCHATRDPGLRVGDFVRHRIIRVIPLYWLMTCIALAVFLVMPERVNSSGGETDVLASFLLLPTDGKYLVQVGWTLAYEFYFYLLFSVGLLFERRTGRGLVVAAIVALVAIGQLGPHGVVWGFLTSNLLLEFAAGMLLYSLFETRTHLPPLAACALIALGIAILAGCNEVGGVGFLSSMRAFDYGAAAVLIVGGVVMLERRVAGRRSRFLEMLGDSSYSLYLSHVFVLGGFALVLGGLERMGTLASLLMVPAMAAAAVAVAYACYRWVERPMTKALRGALDHRAATGTGRITAGHGHPAG